MANTTNPNVPAGADEKARRRAEQICETEPQLHDYRRQLSNAGHSDTEIARRLSLRLNQIVQAELDRETSDRATYRDGYVPDEPTAEGEDLELLLLEAGLDPALLLESRPVG